MPSQWARRPDILRVFLGGDVMTGRAIDQLFATHNPDEFGKADHVPAARYLSSSARLHGAQPGPLPHDYIWGSALEVLDAAEPDFRLVNLETAITTSNDWARKSYNFRMHPANVGCLTAAGLDCVSLANNHTLDFGADGLVETMASLRAAGIGYCGAGADIAEARRPYVHRLSGDRRILVFAWGFGDCGIRWKHWAAGSDRPGIHYAAGASEETAKAMAQAILACKGPDDLVIVSLHWGGNWVRAIPPQQRRLARYLIDEAGVDLIHGHSSHHVLPIELYRGRLILYGCGDLINDSEGRPDQRARKGHLGALYFADIDPRAHRLTGLRVRSVQRRRFRLETPSEEDARWMQAQLRNLHSGNPRPKAVGQPGPPD